MRVVQQILSPAVQHAEETDLRAQMLWIGGDDAQCLRRCPEQDVVDDGLVLERDDLDLLGHGEHNVTEPAYQAGTRSGTVGIMTSSVSKGLTVAHTLSVAIMRYRAVVARLR